MANKSRVPLLLINRSTFIAAIPIFFLMLLGIWTILNTSVSAVKADPSPASAFAIVKKASANLREGPGTGYRILGKSLKGASLPVSGKYDDAAGQRWYKCYLKALGDVWVSATVVVISPTNANIPTVALTSAEASKGPTPYVTPTTITVYSSTTGNVLSGNSSNTNSNNPPANSNPAPQPQPPSNPNPAPATTPELSG